MRNFQRGAKLNAQRLEKSQRRIAKFKASGSEKDSGPCMKERETEYDQSMGYIGDRRDPSK